MGKCTCRAREGWQGGAGIAWSVGGGVCYHVGNNTGCWLIVNREDDGHSSLSWWTNAGPKQPFRCLERRQNPAPRKFDLVERFSQNSKTFFTAFIDWFSDMYISDVDEHICRVSECLVTLETFASRWIFESLQLLDICVEHQSLPFLAHLKGITPKSLFKTGGSR